MKLLEYDMMGAFVRHLRVEIENHEGADAW